MKIAALINYCSNDYRFIKKTIDNVSPFCSQVIVTACDHFFDGTEENRELLDTTYKENPTATFVEYEWTPQYWTQYWSNMSRLISINQLQDDIDWLLLLDSDEIIDTKLFVDFLQKTKFDKNSYNLKNYFYFREPIYQSYQTEDSVVLCRRELVNPNVFDIDNEREQYTRINPLNERNVTNNGIPMVHHYSWVRNKEQMLKKVQTWWHRNDRYWSKLVEEEFSHEFTGVDFIHGYKYKTVENRYNL
jgi:hypothetical protein